MRHQDGLSLLELVVALAVASICGYGGMVLMDSLLHQQAVAKSMEARSDVMASLFTLGDRASPTARFADFRAETTYWRAEAASSLPGLIVPHAKPAPAFKAPAALGGGKQYRDSWTLEITDLEKRRAGDTGGILLTRCIPKTDAGKTSFDLSEVLAYKKVPVLTGFGGGKGETTISCCEPGKKGLTNCVDLDEKSAFRTRLFHGNQTKLRAIPAAAELKYVAGAGMFVSFDDARAPSLMSVHLFTVDNECQRVADGKTKPLRGACNRDTRVDAKLIQRQVLANVHGSGILRIGR